MALDPETWPLQRLESRAATIQRRLGTQYDPELIGDAARNAFTHLPPNATGRQVHVYLKTVLQKDLIRKQRRERLLVPLEEAAYCHAPNTLEVRMALVEALSRLSQSERIIAYKTLTNSAKTQKERDEWKRIRLKLKSMLTYESKCKLN